MRNKEAESAAGNYFQPGTFRGPPKDPPPEVTYDDVTPVPPPLRHADLDQGHRKSNTDADEVSRENIDLDNKYRDLDENDSDSGKGTASVEGDSSESHSDDVMNDDVALEGETPGIALVDEVGVDVEHTEDPDFLDREKAKIKTRAEQTSIIPGRGYAPKQRRRTRPLEPLFEFGEEEAASAKNSIRAAREVFNY